MSASAPRDQAVAPPPRRRTLPLRLHLVALVVATLLPALGAGLVAMREGIRRHEADFERGLTDTAEGLALAMDGELRMVESVLRALASADELEPGGDLEGFHRRRSVTARELGIDFVFIAPAPAYRRLFDTRRPFGAPLAAGLGPGPDGAALHAAAAGQVQAVGILRDSDGHWVTGLMAPVMREGRVIGVLAGLIGPERLGRLLATHTLTRRGFATLVDAQGRIVSRSRAADRFTGEMIPEAMLSLHLAGNGLGIARGRSMEGAPVVIANAPLVMAPGWRIIVADDAVEHDSVWWRQVNALALGGLGAFLLAGGAAFLLARRLARPVAALADHAARVGAGLDPTPIRAIPDAGVSEFAALRAALLDAAAQLARQREEAHAAAAAVREGRGLLQSVIDALPDAVFVKDEAGRYQLVNRAGLRMLGTDLDGTIGREHGFALPPEPRERMTARHARVRATGLPERSEEDRVLPDGSLRRFETLTVAWSPPDGSAPAGTIGVSRDVTDQRRLEAQLLHAEAMLTDLVRRVTVSALTSGLAHELNQPLAAASNYIAAARQVLVALEAMPAAAPERPARFALTREALDSAIGQVQRAGEIIRRLRDFMRGQPLAARPEDPVAVVTEALLLAQASLPGMRGIAVATDLPEGLPAVPMDRVQIQQVLLNLLRNAIEALQADPPEEPRIRLAARRAAGEGGIACLELSVTDNGPGLPRAIADGAFEPLRTNKPEAMGLGLAICREIAQAHGGMLLAGPGAEGRGACIRLLLPLVPLDAEEEAPGTARD